MKIIETDRLLLRTWKNEDASEYYAINQDSKVNEFLIGPLTMDQVRTFICFVTEQYNRLGYTLLAAEQKASNQFIGL